MTIIIENWSQLVASESTYHALRKAVESLRGGTSKLDDVLVLLQAEDFPVAEVTHTKGLSISFKRRTNGPKTQTRVLTYGEKFTAAVKRFDALTPEPFTTLFSEQ